MSIVVTMTLKGRITLPKKLRVALGMVPGDRLMLVRSEDGTVVIQRKAREERRPISGGESRTEPSEVE